MKGNNQKKRALLLILTISSSIVIYDDFKAAYLLEENHFQGHPRSNEFRNCADFLRGHSANLGRFHKPYSSHYQ